MILDLLLRDGNVVTMDAARPSARAVGVLHGRIVGFDDDVAALPARETIDLRGATVTPGFIDAHCHTTWFGLGLGETDLSGAHGLDEVYELLAEAASASTDATGAGGDWVLATGFNQRDHGGLFPELSELDRATGSRPLLVRHVSGHLAVANSAALKRAGAYASDFADPDGGVVCRDADGTPTGLLQETAQRLVQDLIQPHSMTDIVAALDRATRQYAREGITSFTEAGIGGGWIGHSPIELAAYQRARREGKLHARAQLMPVLDVLHPLDANRDDDFGLGLDLGAVTGLGDDHLSLGPVKVFLDGSLLGETAALTADYCGHPHTSRGYFLAEPDDLRHRIFAAYRSGWAVAAHAIGDRAVDLAIDILTECVERYGPPTVPNRIEHCSVVRPDQLPRLAAAGIAVTPQSSFFGPMGDQMAASLGNERAAWAYRAASFLDAGILVAGSSDRPVADGNVLRGIQAFVDRVTAEGRIFGSETERITPEQALAAYTVDAAKATGCFATRGSLVPGKLADLTVLGASPLAVPADEISAIPVLATLVGGVFTHRALSADTASPALTGGIS